MTKSITMKNTLTFLFGLGLLISSFTLKAQDETLINSGTSVGGFFGIITEVGSINGTATPSMGGGVGLVLDNLFIGAYGLATANYEGYLQGDDANLDIAHGGLWLGYNYKTYKLVHLYSSAKVGWGAVDIDPDLDFNRRGSLDAVFVVTPEVGVELNVARWFRIAASLSYRVVSGVDAAGLSNNDFGGLNAGITMRFGWFGRKRNSDNF